MEDLELRYKNYADRINTLLNERRVLAEQYFKQECRKLFSKWHNLKEFKWQQYTPYFCDGSPCTFYVRTESVVVNGVNTEYIEVDDNDEYALYFDESDNLTELGKEIEMMTVDISNMLHKFDDDDLKHLYGDHAEVIVTRDPNVFTEFSIKTEDASDHD